MKENYRNMNFQITNNSKFRYMKYVDNEDTQTLLFFLKSDSLCKSETMICDKNLKDAKIKEFDRIYSKKGENIWIEVLNGRHYIIELVDEPWSFSVTIRPDE